MKDILKKINKKEKVIIGITIGVLIITLISIIVKDTHAFYSDKVEIPLIEAKIGNFAKQDKEEYLASQDNSGLETTENMTSRGDTLRRYQGTSVNNYICFGTNDKDVCLNDQDKYMYRIIGIDTETQELKIIKKEALNTKYYWPKTAADWPS